jgi:hypothetical protein
MDEIDDFLEQQDEIARQRGSGKSGNGHINGGGHSNGHDPEADFTARLKDDPGQAGTALRWSFDNQIYPTWSYWLDRELDPADYLLGELLSTTSRVMLVGATGLGKTHFAMALAGQQVLGRNFLHWRTPRPARVLYLEGEMSRRLDKRRLTDLARRTGEHCDNLIVLSREDYPDMPPLNTPEGQSYLDAAIEWLEGRPNSQNGHIDEIVFDNIGALFTGEMREPLQWAGWQRKAQDLTRRRIAQLYLHHANDEGRGYGDKSREWGLDTLMSMVRINRPDAELAFELKFLKARERTPENRTDFDDAVITLANDEWSSDRSGGDRIVEQGSKTTSRKNNGKLEDIALDALAEAINREGEPVPGRPLIPSAAHCVPVKQWRRYFGRTYISDGTEKVIDETFRRLANKLRAGRRICVDDPWAWIPPR